MKNTLVAVLAMLSASTAEFGYACDSTFCEGQHPKCNSSWCAPGASSCEPELVALNAATGVLRADGHPAPFSHQMPQLDSRSGDYAVVLSYSGARFLYLVSVDSQSCQATKVELRTQQ